MTEPQCPAVSTVLGAISVPVQRNTLPNVIRATDGYSPAEALFPPTTASDGAAHTARMAHASTRVRMGLPSRIAEGPTRFGE